MRLTTIRLLIVVFLFGAIQSSCISNLNRNNPNTDKYFVVTEECFIGLSVGQQNYRKASPCEYYQVLGTIEDAGQKYHTIKIEGTAYFINDKYGQITWGTANINFICEQSKKPKKPLITEVKKKENGPFLFDIRELTEADILRDLEIYNREGSDQYYALENDCIYDPSLRFSCKDSNGKVARYYIPGIELPNKFNIAEYQYFGKFTEKAFYSELDGLAKIKWEAVQKAQQEAENKRLRAEKEKEKARLQKEQEKKQKEEENRLAKLDSLRSAGCPLAMESWSWSRSSEAHITISGKVMNLTENRITHVKVHVEIYDKGGNFIAGGWSYLQYQVLMPYQSSPFQIIERWNPLMAKASVRVQLPSGEMIQGSCSMGK
jgi:hypothetical protein